jgi:tetratricopeptide (TPR) repeat protein
MFPSEKFFANRYKILAGLMLPAIVVYFKSLSFGFTMMDEQWMIVQNDLFLQSSESIKQAFTKPLAGLYFRPLFLISIITDYRLGKLSPHIYHLTNLLWHLLNVVIFYRFLRFYGTGQRTAFWFTIIFSVHPVLLHAVAWVPGRNDVMLSVFTLISLNQLKLFIDNGKNKHLALHLLAFVLALFTKESAVILPLLYGCIFFLYKRTNSKLFLSFGLWIVIGTSWFFLRKHVVSIPSGANADFFSNLNNFLLAIIIYTGKVILPAKLSVFPTIKNSALWPGIIILLLIPFAFFKPGIPDKKTAVTGLALFFGMLLIPIWFSALNTNREHYEHRIYTSMAGAALFISHLKFTGSKRFSSVALVVFAVLCGYTFTRMEIYRNEENFLDRAANESPDFYLFQMQKAEMYFKKGEYGNSIEYFTKALDVRPDKTDIYNNRGGAYYHLRMYKEAIADFTKAISDSGFHKEYYINRCAVYEAAGDYNNAMKDLQVMIKCCREMVPREFEQRLTNEWLKYEVGALDDKILKDPKNASLYFERYKLWSGINENERALEDLKKACELAPENEEYLKMYLEKSGEHLKGK